MGNQHGETEKKTHQEYPEFCPALRVFFIPKLAMLLDQILASDAYTPINKKLAREIGIIPALYLMEMLSQRRRFGGNGFYFSGEQMEQELGLTKKQQELARNFLQKKGFISFEKKGLPAKNYYTIYDEKIVSVLSQELYTNGTDKSCQKAPLETSKCRSNKSLSEEPLVALGGATKIINNNNKYNSSSSGYGSDGKKSKLPSSKPKPKKQEASSPPNSVHPPLIKTKDDIRELFTQEELQTKNIRKALEVIRIMIDNGYEAPKSREFLEKKINRLTRQTRETYGFTQGQGLNRHLTINLAEQMYLRAEEKKKEIKNHFSTFANFMKKERND